MQITLSESRGLTSALSLFFVIVAVVVGVLTGTQSTTTGAAIVAIIAMVMFAFITPTAALVTLLILAPLRTLIETEAPGLIPLEIGQLLIALTVVSWGMSRIAAGKQLIRLRWSPLYVPFGLFFAIISLNVFAATSTGAWLTEWLKWAIMFVLIVLVVDEGRWEWLIFGLVMAGVGNALIGFYIFFGGSGALHLYINELPFTAFRAFGTFGQPNPFGGFLGLIAPLALGAALGYGQHTITCFRQRHSLSGNQRPWHSLGLALIYFVAFVILSAGVIASWSRGAWLGLFIALVFVFVAIPRKWWHSLALLVVTVSVAFILWNSGLLPGSIVARINSATAEIFTPSEVRGVDITAANYAIVERLAHWQAALNMAQFNPWMGVGFGNYETTYAQYRLINWDEALGHAHNYYLNVFAETGMIGLLGYLILWLAVLWISWHSRRHPDSVARFVIVGLVGTWVYLAAHSLTDKLYVNNIFLHLGIMLGILVVLHRQTTNPIRVR